MSDLYFQQLCTKETLYFAWQHVKDKNTAGGIDHKTVDEYAVNLDKNINDLLVSLHSGKYIQMPYKEVFIPKNSTEKRRLGLLTVNDKVLQTAVSQILTPVFEREFLKVSYGYRSHFGPVKAINKVRHLISQEHYAWCASCDIDNFFDSVPHELLFRRLGAFLKSPGIIELIKMFVQMGSVGKYLHWKDSRKGIPQGGVISPMLANFYLHPLDKLMVNKKYGYVRYADDCVILGKTESEAKWALNEAVQLISDYLQLSLNEGVDIFPVANGFEFLGILFKGSQITLSDRKFNRLVLKMDLATRKGNGIVTGELKDVMQGISAFYCKLVPQEILSKLDDELIAVLKNRIMETKPGKNKLTGILNEVRQLEFFSHRHNFQRAEYVGALFTGQDKKTKPDNKVKLKAGILNSGKAVLKRKHEYRKLESAGFDLVLSTPGLVVGKHENKLIVKKGGIVVQEVPLANLKNVTILNDGIGFSSNVVQSCAEYKVSIDFLKHDGLPYAMLHSPVFFGATTGIAQLNAYQNGKGFHLAARFVSGKISNQVNLLKYFGKYYFKRNNDFASCLKSTEVSLKEKITAIAQLKQDDLDIFRQSLFGIEGQASSLYWAALRHLIKARVPFESRERQGATDLVNCMLNYGYGILYARISEALIKARLNPDLSYLHKPENNRPSLVYDLIEEFRQQIVDRVVVAVITKNKNLKVTDGQLDEHTKRMVATKVIERLNAIEEFRNSEMRMFEIIQHQANSIVRFLTGDLPRYKPYIRKW